MMVRWLAGAGIVLMLAGCATTADTVRTPPTAEAVTAADAARRAWWAAYPAWAFTGRAAIESGGRGGNGRIEWQQHDARRYEIALSAPITRQSWRLSGDLHSESGRIDGLEGGPRQGDDAEALLLETTGWQVPLQQIGDWVRGMPADPYPLAAIEYDTQGRPSKFEQAGWTVRYTAWRPGAAGGPDLPAKVEAERRDGGTVARVRLVIEDWTFAAP
jgi:outer membrane lipoprotein LolB